MEADLLKEFVELCVERKIREVDVSDGSRVPHGSLKHVKDLEQRIASLKTWRDRQKRGSESRANYSRLISRLKGELASAQRNAAKRLRCKVAFSRCISSPWAEPPDTSSTFMKTTICRSGTSIR